MTHLNCAVLFMLLQQATAITGNKAKPLALLVLLPLTGREPQNGAAQRVAIQIAIDAANNRSDILPDYQLQVEIRDEGALAAQAVRDVVDFFSSTKSAAPIFCGPQITNGCAAVADMVQFINVVQIGISCSAASFTANRRIYPNLYRLLGPTENTYYRIVALAKWAGWDSMAFVYENTNSAGVDFAEILNVQLGDANISVPFSAGTFEMSSEQVEALATTRVRIITLIISTPAFLQKFLCLAYMQGITGSRYVFIMTSAISYVNPSQVNEATLPKGCKRYMLVEQFEKSLWATGASPSISDRGNTSLGYDLQWFMAEFNRRTNGVGSTWADFSTIQGTHDAVLAAIVGLNMTDSELSLQNLSLSEYSKHPVEVMQAMNWSMANIRISGLRLGPQQFSSRLEMDSDVGVIYQMVNGSFRNPFLISYTESDDFSWRDFSISAVNSIPDLWATHDGKPPKAMPIMVEIFDSFEIISYVIFLVVAGIVFALHIFNAVTLLVSRNNRHYIAFRFAVCLGCCILTLGAALLVSPVTKATCYLVRITLVVSATLISGSLSSLFGHLWQFWLAKQREHLLETLANIGQGFSVQFLNGRSMVQIVEPLRQRLLPTISKRANLAMYATIVGFTANAAVLLVWITARQIDADSVEERPRYYDGHADAMISEKTVVCIVSPNESGMMESILSITIIVAVFGSLIAYVIKRNSLKIFGIQKTACINSMRLAIWNVTGLAVVWVVCVPLLSIYGAILQRVGLAVLTLIIATSTSILVTWPSLWKQQLRSARVGQVADRAAGGPGAL